MAWEVVGPGVPLHVTRDSRLVVPRSDVEGRGYRPHPVNCLKMAVSRSFDEVREGCVHSDDRAIIACVSWVFML